MSNAFTKRNYLITEESYTLADPNELPEIINRTPNALLVVRPAENRYAKSLSFCKRNDIKEGKDDH